MFQRHIYIRHEMGYVTSLPPPEYAQVPLTITTTPFSEVDRCSPAQHVPVDSRFEFKLFTRETRRYS